MEEDGRMRRQESRKRRIIYYVFLLNGILYSVYLFLRLMQALLLPDSDDRTSVPTIIHHGMVLGAVVMTVVWNLQTYLLLPALSTIVFNEVVTLLESPLLTRKKGPRELQMQFMPCMCLCFAMMPMIPYAISPESCQTVYSSLHDMGFRSIWLIFVCALYEYGTFFFLTNAFNVGVLVHTAFLQATEEELKAVVAKLSSGGNRARRETILRYVQTLQIVQLRVTYFSRVYSVLIHLLKLECIFDGVAGLFIFIKLWDTHAILAALGIYVGVGDSVCYPLLYGQAYEIPLLMKDYKDHVALLSFRSVGSEDERREMRQLLQSIPEIGIKVGGFHYLNRETSMEYYEFIISSVVDLLLTFPGPLKV